MNVIETREGTIADQLRRFYQTHELGNDGGEHERWATVKLGWLKLYFPNTNSRKRALFFHDAHHLATGYNTDLPGEAEIGAWEIASGCRDFWAAWFLNFMGFLMGLVIAPRRTYRAFVRGRHSRNLYDGRLSREEIAALTVSELQKHLRLTKERVHPQSLDRLVFVVWALAPAASTLAITALVLYLVLT